MAYHFYLGNMLLPIAPEKFTLKINNANQTYTLINEGEINVLNTLPWKLSYWFQTAYYHQEALS